MIAFKIPFEPRRSELCPGCGQRIDPDYCWCGSSIEHSTAEGHFPVPIGCECGYTIEGEWNEIEEELAHGKFD